MLCCLCCCCCCYYFFFIVGTKIRWDIWFRQIVFMHFLFAHFLHCGIVAATKPQNIFVSWLYRTMDYIIIPRENIQYKLYIHFWMATSVCVCVCLFVCVCQSSALTYIAVENGCVLSGKKLCNCNVSPEKLITYTNIQRDFSPSILFPFLHSIGGR